MRHDPASAAVEVMLRGLKMYGMAQAVSDLIAQGAPAFDAAVKHRLQRFVVLVVVAERKVIAEQDETVRCGAQVRQQALHGRQVFAA